MKTLKERYEIKQVNQLQERLESIDGLVSEIVRDERSRMIFEAFDKQQMAAAIDIVKKLRAINFGGISSLSKARDVAVADVTKVLGGDKSQGLIRKIINLFKDQKENPLVDVLAFADALNNFFGQFTQYVSALGGKDDQVLGSVVTGKEPNELTNPGALSSLNPEEKKKLGALQNVIIKGFKPEGVLANIGKNWVDKYLKGKEGLKQLANDMLKMKLKELNAISASVTNSLKNVEAVGQAAAGAAQQGSLGTTGSTGSEVSTASSAEQGTKSSKPDVVAPGAQVVDNPATKKIIDKIKPEMDALGVKDVNKLVGVLEKLGVLKLPD